MAQAVAQGVLQREVAQGDVARQVEVEDVLGASLRRKSHVDTALQRVDGQRWLNNVDTQTVQFHVDEIFFCVLREVQVGVKCGTIGQNEVETYLRLQVRQVDVWNTKRDVAQQELAANRQIRIANTAILQINVVEYQAETRRFLFLWFRLVRPEMVDQTVEVEPSAVLLDVDFQPRKQHFFDEEPMLGQVAKPHLGLKAFEADERCYTIIFKQHQIADFQLPYKDIDAQFVDGHLAAKQFLVVFFDIVLRYWSSQNIDYQQHRSETAQDY